MKNYLFNLYPNFPQGFELDERKDPDAVSEALYHDIVSHMLNHEQNKLPNGNAYELKEVIQRHRNGAHRWEIVLWISHPKQGVIATIGLTSDYIGASVNWAQNASMAAQTITDFLQTARTLGGHIIFPIWIRDSNANFANLSLNNARGGKPYYDRFDLTLYAIKQWYHPDNPVTYLNDEIEKGRIWFEQFSDFKGFADFFHLNSFVHELREVYDLTSFDPASETYQILNAEEESIPTDSDKYANYFRGSNHAIALRNELIDAP